MAGREGLVDTAVKTSRAGYLQRCLIKHLVITRVTARLRGVWFALVPCALPSIVACDR